ncbi:hypothetical protein M153_15670001374 [Pseudoloma neurophilia]|uniref:Uncharacterized protein n=1 Tax=Pseudoloma neurophilia TaxID=146866 RepID=A0A0R0LYV5_9MICR|nr:hypothetical protein M153_15670001374 [Pseudoloma neurophilia]
MQIYKANTKRKTIRKLIYRRLSLIPNRATDKIQYTLFRGTSSWSNTKKNKSTTKMLRHADKFSAKCRRKTNKYVLRIKQKFISTMSSIQETNPQSSKIKSGIDCTVNMKLLTTPSRISKMQKQRI